MNDPYDNCLEQIEQRFPEWQVDITRLFDQDSGFRELCRDYGEVADKLKHWQLHLAHTETVTHDWLVLLLALEAELVETLKTECRGRAPRRT